MIRSSMRICFKAHTSMFVAEERVCLTGAVTRDLTEDADERTAAAESIGCWVTAVPVQHQPSKTEALYILETVLHYC